MLGGLGYVLEWTDNPIEGVSNLWASVVRDELAKQMRPSIIGVLLVFAGVVFFNLVGASLHLRWLR